MERYIAIRRHQALIVGIHALHQDAVGQDLGVGIAIVGCAFPNVLIAFRVF